MYSRKNLFSISLGHQECPRENEPTFLPLTGQSQRQKCEILRLSAAGIQEDWRGLKTDKDLFLYFIGIIVHML